MKVLPACLTCVNSGFLCNSCQKRLDTGQLTDFELELAKDLVELEENEHEQFGFLKDVSFYKAIDYEDVVILEVGNNDKLKFTKELMDWIRESYKIDKIILIEKTNKPKSVVESLIAPSKLVSLNEIFLATGDIEFKAVIRNSDRNNILFTSNELEELIYELTGNTTRIEYL
jgi:transcription antitermination factor NusA-like protein